MGLKFSEVPVNKPFYLRGAPCFKKDHLTYVSLDNSILGEVQATDEIDGHISMEKVTGTNRREAYPPLPKPIPPSPQPPPGPPASQLTLSQFSLASRELVFAAIAMERNYQDSRWPNHEHSPTEFLVYIDHYVKLGLVAATTETGETAVLDTLRKIAALAVAAMEQNGVVFRQESADMAG